MKNNIYVLLVLSFAMCSMCVVVQAQLVNLIVRNTLLDLTEIEDKLPE